MVNKEFYNNEYWSEAWVRHIENYLNSPPRCGIWLRQYFKNESLSLLECAGGSCRDSRYLFDIGRKSIGSDFDKKTLEYVKEKYIDSKFSLKVEDGFNLSFADKSIDIVFHNGFWVCYDDDLKIVDLLSEQVRVSRSYSVALLHNLKNSKLVEQFKELSSDDNLYKIRFFDFQQINMIINLSGINYKSIRFEKFGGPVDFLYQFEKKIPIISPIIRWLVPRLYRFQPWSKVERIAVIIELHLDR